MIRSSMSAPFVTRVVLPMGADPINHHHAGSERHRHFQAVSVALHVEDHHALRQETRAGEAPANVLRLVPRGALAIGEPVIDPAAGVRMLAAETLERLAAKYFHPCQSIRALR